MKRFIIATLAAVTLLVLALATTRQSRAEIDTYVNCQNAQWWVCQWQNGYPGEQQGKYQTPAEQQGYDRAYKACRSQMNSKDLMAWDVDATYAIPKSLDEANKGLAMCNQCKAQKPGGGRCRGGKVDGSFGGATYGGQPPGADKSEALARCFEQTARDKIADGYFVKNDGFWRATKHAIQDLTWWSNTKKGGRCGEFGARGMEWMKSCVDNLFGVDKAVLDDIQVEEKSGVRGRAENADWSSYLSPDQMFESNHRATRVVMPDGRRFVLDFWEAVSTGNPRMQTEEEWARTWKKKVGDQLIGVDSGVVLLTEDQTRLSAAIKRYGEQKGIEYFRNTYNPKTVGRQNVKGSPETWINSWKVQPW